MTKRAESPVVGSRRGSRSAVPVEQPPFPPPEPEVTEGGDVSAGARQTSPDAEKELEDEAERKYRAEVAAGGVALRGCVISVARILTTLLDASVPRGRFDGPAIDVYERACDELKPIIDALWRAERNLRVWP